MDFMQMAVVAGTTAFSAGAAWGGAKAALNGTKRRVEYIEKTVNRHAGALEGHAKDDALLQSTMVDRLARIETKIDLLMDDRKK
jgi:hypothetical protein